MPGLAGQSPGGGLTPPPHPTQPANRRGPPGLRQAKAEPPPPHVPMPDEDEDMYVTHGHFTHEPRDVTTKL